MVPTHEPDPAFRALLDAVADPARRDRTVSADGTDFQLRYDPEPGVELRVHATAAPDETLVVVYAAATERPPSYPPGMPFLPGTRASLRIPSEDSGVWFAMWNVLDRELALAELFAQSTAAGWTEAGEDDTVPGLRILHFNHPKGRERTIHVTRLDDHAMISLVDSPRE